MPHCRIKKWPFSPKKSSELQMGSICTRKCCGIKNHQTSKCCRFVIRQITQTQTETEAVIMTSQVTMFYYHDVTGNRVLLS